MFIKKAPHRPVGKSPSSVTAASWQKDRKTPQTDSRLTSRELSESTNWSVRESGAQAGEEIEGVRELSDVLKLMKSSGGNQKYRVGVSGRKVDHLKDVPLTKRVTRAVSQGLTGLVAGTLIGGALSGAVAYVGVALCALGGGNVSGGGVAGTVLASIAAAGAIGGGLKSAYDHAKDGFQAKETPRYNVEGELAVSDGYILFTEDGCKEGIRVPEPS